MRIDIITLFPEFFESYFEYSILKRAQENGKVELEIHNLRDHSTNKQKSVDDYQFGGGSGMVICIQPIDNCISKLKSEIQFKINIISLIYIVLLNILIIFILYIMHDTLSWLFFSIFKR